MPDPKPWECHPDLTAERLRAVAQFFANTAREVAALYSPDSGDDSWSLGCRRNSWWRNRMLQISRSRAWPWLGVVSPTKGFVFTIGLVPLRFYRGLPSRPPQTTLAVRHDELRQQSLAFGDSEMGELKWRFSIETDGAGNPVNILLVGHTPDGSVECFWPIPFEADVTSIRAPDYEEPTEVQIPPPLDDADESGTASSAQDG